jgi:hypothetical protein
VQPPPSPAWAYPHDGMYARKRLLLLCVLCGGLRNVPWTDLKIEAIHTNIKYMRGGCELHSEGGKGLLWVFILE